MKTNIQDTGLKSVSDNRRGGALLICLLLLGVLSFFAGSVYRLTIPEVSSSVYHQKERAAFYNAEAGVQYVMARMSQSIQEGDLQMTTQVMQVNYAAPEGYDFEEIRTITRLANGNWMTFVVTGRFENAKAVIQATVSRPRLLTEAGIFGDHSLTVQPNNKLFSYYSSLIRNPTAADSTGEANIGSNESITMLNNIFLDGMVLLGESLFGIMPLPPSGFPYAEAGRIDPDPLGAIGGPLAEAFTYYANSANNDNATAPDIVNNRLVCGPNRTKSLPGGVFYLTDFDLGSGSTLNIGGTPNNPTIILLHGELNTQPNCVINVTNGLPTNLLIYSDDVEDINLQPNGNFRALVYAPYADIDLKPNGDLHGVFWGRDLLLLPNNDIFIDVDLLNQFLSAHVRLEQWKQVLD